MSSLVSYLRAQLRGGSSSSISATSTSAATTKPDRITNFLQVPFQLERVNQVEAVVFDFWFTCVLGQLLAHFYDSSLEANFWVQQLRRCSDTFLLTFSFVAVSLGLSLVDASRLYHNIRSQSALKLYVLFNVGEVMDKLLSSFGLDVFDALFGAASVFHYGLALVYTFIHALVLLYQVVTLNVSANTQNNAILTLLVSNQFMEVKSAVFKKFDRENLFQLACADAVERFVLLTFGSIIALRNWSEYGFAVFGVPEEVWSRVVVPIVMLLGSEVVVDVLKHAFITKFNSIPPMVYSIYAQSIANDLSAKNGCDQSPIVSRKLGFSSLPLCCLVLSLIIKSFNFRGFVAFFTAALVLKCILGSFLVAPQGKAAAAAADSSSKVE